MPEATPTPTPTPTPAPRDADADGDGGVDDGGGGDGADADGDGESTCGESKCGYSTCDEEVLRGCCFCRRHRGNIWPFDLEPQYHPIATGGSRSKLGEKGEGAPGKGGKVGGE